MDSTALLKVDEHPTTVPAGVWSSLPLPLTVGGKITPDKLLLIPVPLRGGG